MVWAPEAARGQMVSIRGSPAGLRQDCARPPFLRAMLASSRRPWVAGKTRADGAPDTWLPACLLQDTLWGLVSKKSKNLSFEKKASVNYKKRNQLWGWSQAGDAPAACAAMVPAALAESGCSCKRGLGLPRVPRTPHGCPGPLLLQPEREARPPADPAHCRPSK